MDNKRKMRAFYRAAFFIPRIDYLFNKKKKNKLINIS